ncbi:MAG: cytochrome C oxidase subunit IV family protein [Gemmatimonadales bacterium]
MHAPTHDEHAHPGAGTYVKIAVILFVITALEVGGYEVVRRGEPAGLATALQPVFVPFLIVLSALKFALVAMFYMHLKMDSRLFSTVFVFPIIIAAVVILAMLVLFSYNARVSGFTFG